MPVAVGDVGRIVSLAGDAGRANREALKANLEATRLVTAAIKRDAAVLSRRMLHQNRSLRRVLLSNAQRSHRRVSAELIGAVRRTRTKRRAELAALRSHRRRLLLERLTLASALPLMAAFGRRGNPLAPDNLAIVLSLLIWRFGDTVTDLL